MLTVALWLGLAQISEQQRLMLDWGGLTRYGSENAEIRVRPDVVFLGDDITEKWSPFFPGKAYLNRGIERQTSAQMLVRFRQDVIALKPRVVVIQAGSNDIASVAGPATEATVADWVSSMVELAQLHGIKVVLASVTPVCDCAGVTQTKRRPAGKLLGLNGWLKEYAAQKGAAYLDWWAVLAQGRLMNREYTVDGFLPNAAGYARMAESAERAIGVALGAGR